MNDFTGNSFCLPQDVNSRKNAIALELGFEFILGAYTPVPPGHSTSWRTMPFSLCCTAITSQKLKARACVQVKDRPDMYADTDDIVFIPEGVTHRISDLSGKDAVSLWCHFRATVFRSADMFEFFELPFIIRGKQTFMIKSMLSKLVGLPSQLDFHGSLRQQLDGITMSSLIISCGKQKQGSMKRVAGLRRLRPALSLLDNDDPHLYSTTELAESVGLSNSRFLALFHEYTNSSPTQYMEQKRFRKACELLYSTDMKLSAIAEHLQYCDAFHFSRKFTRLAGISPSQYRRRGAR